MRVLNDVVALAVVCVSNTGVLVQCDHERTVLFSSDALDEVLLYRKIDGASRLAELSCSGKLNVSEWVFLLGPRPSVREPRNSEFRH